MEFLEDSVWQLKILFLEQLATFPSKYLFHQVFLIGQQKAHIPVLKSVFLPNLLRFYTTGKHNS